MRPYAKPNQTTVKTVDNAEFRVAGGMGGYAGFVLLEPVEPGAEAERRLGMGTGLALEPTIEDSTRNRTGTGGTAEDARSPGSAARSPS